jgi:hypothetical protein
MLNSDSMKTLNFFSLSVLFLFCLNGCKKDQDETITTNPTTNTNGLLQSHYWRMLYSSGSYTDSSGTINFYNAVDSCEADDRFTFHANGLLIGNPGTITCGEVEDTINWVLQNQSELIIIEQTDSSLFRIEYLTTNSLKLTAHTYGTTSMTDTIQFVYP